MNWNAARTLIVLSIILNSQSKASASPQEPTFSYDKCDLKDDTGIYLSEDDLSLLKKYDEKDIFAVCGSGKNIGSDDFNDSWREAVNQCLSDVHVDNLERFGNRKFIPLTPKGIYGGKGLNCIDVFKTASLYNVFDEQKTIEFISVYSRIQDKKDKDIKKIRENTDNNVNAKYELAIKLLDIENCYPDAVTKGYAEALNLIKSSYKEGYAEKTYIYLYEIENNLVIRNKENIGEKKALAEAFNALSEGGYSLASIKLAERFVNGALSYYRNGDISGGDRVYYTYAYDYLKRAKQQGNQDVIENVTKLQSEIDKLQNNSGSVNSASLILSSMILSFSMEAGKYIPINGKFDTNYNQAEFEENQKRFNEQLEESAKTSECQYYDSFGDDGDWAGAMRGC